MFNKFKIIEYIKGTDGLYLKIKPNISSFNSFENFIKSLFPDFSFVNSGFPVNSNNYDEWEGHNFIDKKECSFMVSFNGTPKLYPENSKYFKELNNYKRKLGKYVEFKYWGDDDKKFNYLLKQFSQNPDVLVIDKSNPIKKKSFIILNYDYDSLFSNLNNFLASKKITSIEYEVFDLDIDDAVIKEISIDKIRKVVENYFSNYECTGGISLVINSLKLDIMFSEDNTRVEIFHPETLDVSLLKNTVSKNY